MLAPSTISLPVLPTPNANYQNRKLVNYQQLVVKLCINNLLSINNDDMHTDQQQACCFHDITPRSTKLQGNYQNGN